MSNLVQAHRLFKESKNFNLILTFGFDPDQQLNKSTPCVLRFSIQVILSRTIDAGIASNFFMPVTSDYELITGQKPITAKEFIDQNRSTFIN